MKKVFVLLLVSIIFVGCSDKEKLLSLKDIAIVTIAENNFVVKKKSHKIKYYSDWYEEKATSNVGVKWLINEIEKSNSIGEINVLNIDSYKNNKLFLENSTDTYDNFIVPFLTNPKQKDFAIYNNFRFVNLYNRDIVKKICHELNVDALLRIRFYHTKNNIYKAPGISAIIDMTNKNGDYLFVDKTIEVELTIDEMRTANSKNEDINMILAKKLKNLLKQYFTIN
jgi:hypothetical protein